MPTLGSLVVFDVLLRKGTSPLGELTLDSVAPGMITRLRVENPLGHLDEIESYNAGCWLFHVRAPKGVLSATVKDRVVVPGLLYCYFVSKSAFSPGAKFAPNARPLPHPDVDEAASCMTLRDYPFCREEGGVWDLMTRADIADSAAGGSSEAIGLYTRVLDLDPTNATACCRIGMALMEKNQNSEAELWLRRSLKLDPEEPLASANLGVLCCRKSEAAIAGNSSEKAWEFVKEGLMHSDDREGMWSTAAFVAYRSGHSRDILPALRLVAVAHPSDWRDFWRVYCVVLMEVGMVADIVRAIPRLGGPETWSTEVASIVIAATQMAGMYKYSLDLLKLLKEHDSNTVNILTGITFDSGEVDESLLYHEKSWEAVSKSESILTCNGVNRVFISNYTTRISEERLFEIHLEWGKAMMSLVKEGEAVPRPPPLASGQKVVVGFIGADFREHAVMMFAFSLVCCLDKTRYDVHVFSNNYAEKSDFVTQRIIDSLSSPDRFHCIHRMAADDAAYTVRASAVRILIDLAGHTSGTRLNVCARKPAPVQITMIGYPNTTGLPQDVMNFRVVDAITDPPCAGAYHTERLLRVSGCFTCYSPPTQIGTALPDVQRDPDAPDVFMFGSYAKLPKISDLVWEAWARILKRVPSSFLLIKQKYSETKPSWRNSGSKSRPLTSKATRIPPAGASSVYRTACCRSSTCEITRRWTSCWTLSHTAVQRRRARPCRWASRFSRSKVRPTGRTSARA
jgi:tetratricopeptide (TPR) repeat protein